MLQKRKSQCEGLQIGPHSVADKSTTLVNVTQKTTTALRDADSKTTMLSVVNMTTTVLSDAKKTIKVLSVAERTTTF